MCPFTRAERPSIVGSALTCVDGRHVKVVVWYDNECVFSNRVIDTLELPATRSHRELDGAELYCRRLRWSLRATR